MFLEIQSDIDIILFHETTQLRFPLSQSFVHVRAQVVLHSFFPGGNQSLFVRLWAQSRFLSVSAVDWSVPWSGHWFCVRCTIQAHVFAGWFVYSQIFWNREGIQPVRHETMDRLCEIRVSACFSSFKLFLSRKTENNGPHWFQSYRFGIGIKWPLAGFVVLCFTSAPQG